MKQVSTSFWSETVSVMWSWDTATPCPSHSTNLIHLKRCDEPFIALLVADMPYGTFHTGDDDAVRNALGS